MSQPTLLIVEDEKNSREGLQGILEENFDVYTASSVKSGIQILESESIDLVLTDLRLGKGSGMEILQRTKTLPNPPLCIIITAYGTVDNAVEAMRHGAYDYITKPLDLNHLSLLLRRASTRRAIQNENRQLKSFAQERFGFKNILGNSPLLKNILEKVVQVANTRATVLIEGESGTGKELIAKAVHQASMRADSPFVTVHCAALSPQLLESELFGHERGAFTGAMERRKGRFEEANGGTLFLDEIGEIDPSTQVKLLRAIGERTIQRVGGNEELKIDTRIVSATNRNLEEMVQKKEFREDLYFRVNVVKLLLPPLRDRPEDIPILMESFLKAFCKENKKEIKGFSKEAQSVMLKHVWAGNIRELRMAVEHGVVLTRGKTIEIENLPESITKNKKTESTPSSKDAPLNLERSEKGLIIEAIESFGGNITKAADQLGISRRTLHRKIKEYKIKAH